MQLVLASASPRRTDLLAAAGYGFEVRPADIDETPHLGERAAAYVERVACEKATAVHTPGNVTLAADTTVVVDGTILAKPADAGDATRMLEALSGRTHEVMTGVAAISATATRPRSFVTVTLVTMTDITASAIAWYLDTGEPEGKAGAYALQGRGGTFVESVSGSVTNVIGLPMVETMELLRAAGVTDPSVRSSS